MDSINAIKGYGKVNPIEDETSPSYPKKTTQKRGFTIAISLILISTLVIGTIIVALTHNKSTTQPPPDPIKTVCSVTQNPNSCFTSISSLKASPPQNDPELIFALSLQLAVNELTNLSSLPKTLISKSNDPGTESALRDCANLFDDALSQLNNSVALVVVGSGKEILTDEKIGDLKTWISGAMTDEETCLDGLEEMGSAVTNEVREKMNKSKEYMSNSLAILANINLLLVKFGIPMH